MRIGMFSDSYLPYASGVVRSVETFAHHLRLLGEDVHIIAPEYPGFKDPDDSIIRFPSLRFSYRSDFRLGVPFNPPLEKRLRELNFDIIHSHSPFLLGWLANKISAQQGAPLVFTHHTLYAEYTHYFKWLPKPVTRQLVNTIVQSYCQKAATVIVPTEVVRSLVVGLGVNTPIEVVETGVDMEEIGAARTPGVRRRFGIRDEAFLLLFVGRLGKEKNLEMLISAVEEIIRRRPDVMLMIAGDGPEKSRLEKTAEKLGIREKVVFTGLLDKKEVAAAYKEADLFVFSSVTETQGLVISEALAAGLPVVAVRAFGVEHMVTDHFDGLLTHASAEDLQRGIERLLDNRSLLRTFSVNARSSRERWSAEAKALQLQRIYRKLLARGRLASVYSEQDRDALEEQAISYD